jgi:hypothetical protein
MRGTLFTHFFPGRISMKAQGTLLQALAIIAMGLAVMLTAKPAEAAAARVCADFCADSCDSHICDPCITVYCTNGGCTGADGQEYFWWAHCY